MQKIMISFPLLISLIIVAYPLNISLYDIYFFRQQSRLYYVNAIKAGNGDIYFEFWGEDDTMRYFIGKNYLTGDNIKFNENEIFSINTNTNWNYHESIIINYNETINILSMNSVNFDYVNIEESIYSFIETKNIIGNYDNSKAPAYKNSIIKLKNGNYFSSNILHDGTNKIYMTIFNLPSNNINGFQKLNQKVKTIGYMNSTNCFQTESEYIQCSFSDVYPTNKFVIGIYDLNFNEKNTLSLGYLLDYTFTKIFHIKGEIGAYIFFDDRANNVPKLFLKKLNENKNNLIDIFNSPIILNKGGKYILDYNLYSSDAIKINDSKFIVILTIKNTFDLLLCICDFNDDYTGIRIKYYYLNLSSNNIKISVNVKVFSFKDNFGLIFYDSISEYPGYLFFNSSIIINENNIDNKNIIIKLFEDSSNTNFIFSDYIKLLNNIFSLKYKIKINNYTNESISGVKIKLGPSEINISDIINFNQQITFESNINGAIPGEYFMEFSILFEEEEEIIDEEFYGIYSENDFQDNDTISKYIFNLDLNFTLTYIIECHEKCDTCNQIGTELNYHCIKCKNSIIYDINYGENCSINCNDYIYINENDEILCIGNCTNDNFIYINENEKYCLNSCTYKNIELYKDESENICYNDCIEAKNGHKYLFENKCILQCPENYTHDINNICILNEANVENIIESTLLESEILGKESNSHNLSENLINDITEIDNTETIKGCHIDINLLLNDYKTKGEILELKELENCSIIYYCYSSDIDTNDLIAIKQNLIFINFSKCRDILISEGIINENSEVLIISKQKLNNLDFSLMNNFNYEVYIENGTKINDISICEKTSIEISLPINEKEKYETAITLYEQGYDIFNLSSNFYYDLCLSSYINNSDLTLNIRQTDIKPDVNTLCLNSCKYEGANLTSKRIRCSCDYDFSLKNGNTNKNNELEEVEENFFAYILDMINYKVIICYKLFFKFENYFYNFGFYTSITMLSLILILFFIYLICGKKLIMLKYLHHEQNIAERLSNLNNQKIQNNIIMEPRTNNKNSKTTIKKKSSLSSPTNKKIKNKDIKRNSAKPLNKMRINNGIKDKNAFQVEISGNELIKINLTKMNLNKINSKENKNDINYNELTYSQAIKQDKRGIINTFFSCLNSKFEIIQILFFPNEFSHRSLTLTLYIYELLLDLTSNALLFSDDVISQKYYNNGELLFITSQILSISSNIISCFIVYITSNLVHYYETFEEAVLEAKNPKKLYKIFIKISWFIYLKIAIFYIIVLIFGIFCSYYLFIFCAIFKKIQKNLYINYIIGTLWSLLYKVAFSIIITVLRKISIYKKYKRLYIISKFIDEKF